MNQIDSAIEARGANRTLRKTFTASKPVPGTYDDIILSDAFLNGKIKPATRRPEGDSLSSGQYVDFYFQLPPDASPQDEDEVGDLMFAAYMYGMYENMEQHGLCGLSADGMHTAGSLQGEVMHLELLGSFKPTGRYTARYNHMIRMRRSMRTGSVTYSVV